MNVSHTNPDAQVNFTSIGIGKDSNEAAIFALGGFLNVMNGSDEDSITDYNQSLEIVNEQFTIEEVESFINKKLESNSDSFFNSYESTNVDYTWDEVEAETSGGFIQEMEVIEAEY